jgi:hypothetical protein
MDAREIFRAPQSYFSGFNFHLPFFFFFFFFFFLYGAPAHIGPWPPLYEVS